MTANIRLGRLTRLGRWGNPVSLRQVNEPTISVPLGRRMSIIGITMNSLTILGLVAGTLTTIAFLPQVVKTWQSKSAKDFSFGMLITFSVGVFLWLVYGLYKNELPIILANLITFALNSIIIVLKLKYR